MIVHNVRIQNETSRPVSGRAHKRIYVGCADTDIKYRDLLVNGRHRWELYSKPTIHFITLDRKGMELEHYKPIAEKVFRDIDGVMIIVSTQTSHDCIVLWEIDYCLSHNIPVVGVDIRHKSEGPIPRSLVGKMTRFGWEWFAEFFDGL